MTCPPIDEAQALQFLQLLGKSKSDARLRAFPHSKNPKKGTIGARKGKWELGAAHTWQQEGRGVYLVINDGGDNAQSITACRAFFVEWDDKPIDWQLTAWQDLNLPQPTFQVLSGGRSVHNYFVLDQPIGPDEWRPVQKALIRYCDGDPACNDPSRVMRLPGALYIGPDGNPSGISELINITGNRYTLERVLSWLPSVHQEPQQQTSTRPPVSTPPTASAAPQSGTGSLPPRSMEEIKAALACIPQRVAGSKTYETYRDTLWGLIDAVEEAGGTEQDAIDLMEQHSPSATCGWNIEQVARSSKRRKGIGTFMRIAKQHGFDASRPDLRRPVPTMPLDGDVFIPPDAPTNAPEPTTPPAPQQQPQQPAWEPPAPTTDADRLQLLHDVAQALLEQRTPFADRLPLMRAQARTLNVTIRDNELQAMLTAARRRRIHGDSDALGPGDILEGSTVPWAWDGLILRGCLNLLVALPKQGKTALAVAMVAAWWRGDGEALGRQFDGPCPPVLIVGTDQGSADWRRMLQPAGLVDHTGRIGGPIVGLYHSGKPLHLDAAGIDTIAAYAEEHPGLLVLIDSLSATISPLGLKEESPEIAAPVAELMEQVEPFQATVVLIHHASKGRAGEGASSASRGSTALPALASQIIKLEPASQAPQDPRRLLTTQGREGAPQALVIRRDGAQWELIGSAEQLQQERSVEQAVEALSDLQHRTLRAVVDHWSDHGIRVTAPRLADAVGQPGKNQSIVLLRALQALERRGLVQSVRQQRPGQGGKAYAFWPTTHAVDALARARAGDSLETRSDGSDGSDGWVTHEDPERSNTCPSKPSDPFNPSDPSDESPARGGGNQSVGRSVGCGTYGLPIAVPNRPQPVGSHAPEETHTIDPHWQAQPVEVTS